MGEAQTSESERRRLNPSAATPGCVTLAELLQVSLENGVWGRQGINTVFNRIVSRIKEHVYLKLSHRQTSPKHSYAYNSLGNLVQVQIL